MQQVQAGDEIKVHYHGKLSNGETFDSSEGGEPLKFKVGSGEVIKGFDEGVIGMKSGDKKTIIIPVEDAYGEKHEKMMFEFPRDQFPDDISPEVGMPLEMSNESGENFRVVISEVNNDNVTLDANHPLAGEALTFDLELVEITKPASKIILP